jgi:hypothetical protein
VCVRARAYAFAVYTAWFIFCSHSPNGRVEPVLVSGKDAFCLFERLHCSVLAGFDVILEVLHTASTPADQTATA